MATTTVCKQEPKINIPYLVMGIIVMVACVAVGMMSSQGHQVGLVTKTINVPITATNLIIASPLGQSVGQISDEDTEIALSQNNAVLNSVSIQSDFLGTLFQIIVIVALSGIIFSLLSVTGLAPRFAAME